MGKLGRLLLCIRMLPGHLRGIIAGIPYRLDQYLGIDRTHYAGRVIAEVDLGVTDADYRLQRLFNGAYATGATHA